MHENTGEAKRAAIRPKYEIIHLQKKGGIMYMTHIHVNKNIRVHDTIVYMKEIRNYKIKKPQYLESSGYIRINEPSGLRITRVVVSGFNHMKEITHIIKLIVGQDDKPLNHIIIDTNLCNQYTEGDIEPGTKKLIQIDYITDDITTKQKKMSENAKYENVIEHIICKSDHDSSDSDHDSSDSNDDSSDSDDDSSDSEHDHGRKHK